MPPSEDGLSVSPGRTVTRTISLPVQEYVGGEWRDLMRVLHGAWRMSTDLANWASHTLARLDVVRTPAMTELPRYAAVDLYALAFGRDRERPARTAGRSPLPVVAGQVGGWEGARIAAASLLREVQRKYLKERGKVVWRRERRTPEYLYPYPFPVHPQAWAGYLGDRGRPHVSLALPGGRVILRLRGGPEFAPQMRVFQRIVDGEVKPQQLKICRQRTGGAHHREDAQRLPGGGHRESYRVMVRISAQVEVMESAPDTVTAELRTGADPFIRLQLQEQPPWVLHAPWARQWIAEHRRFLDDFSDDLKFEKRWPGHKRRRLNRYRERRCEKHARRMTSFLQETAAQAVGHAARRGAGRLHYDDTDRSYAAEFPWLMLAERVEQKCVEAGITFVRVAGGGVAGEDPPEPPAEA